MYSKYYKEDGQLALDVGPFSKALEVYKCTPSVWILWMSNLLQHATGTSPVVIGKPSEAYFRAAIQDLGVAPEHVTHYLTGKMIL